MVKIKVPILHSLAVMTLVADPGAFSAAAQRLQQAASSALKDILQTGQVQTSSVNRIIHYNTLNTLFPMLITPITHNHN